MVQENVYSRNVCIDSRCVRRNNHGWLWGRLSRSILSLYYYSYAAGDTGLHKIKHQKINGHFLSKLNVTNGKVFLKA